MDVEEKYDVLVDNYFELERELLDQALRSMIYSEFSDSRRLISRRLINLLSSARLYVETLPRHAGVIFGGDTASMQKDGRIYDGNLGYRVMEALRNYAQHQNLPVHGGETKYRLDHVTGHTLYSFNPSLDLSEVAMSPKFKKSVLGELADLPKERDGQSVALKPFIREYVEGLGKVQLVMRTESGGRVVEAENTIKGAIEIFKSRYPQERHIALAAGAEASCDKDSFEYIRAENLDDLRVLQKRRHRSEL